jgi:ABC-type lipoprotein release transport system permease subunit
LGETFGVFIFAIVITVLTGWIASKKVSGIDPAEVLRNE